MRFLILRNFCALQHLSISYCKTAFSLLKIYVAAQHFWASEPARQAEMAGSALLFCHRPGAARLLRYRAQGQAWGMMDAARGGLMTAAARHPVFLAVAGRRPAFLSRDRMNITSKPLAYAYLALSMALVGAYVAFSKPLAAAFPVLLLAWIRFGIGVVAMLGWLRRPPTEAPLDSKARVLLFFESFFGNFLFTICMITGVSMTGAVAASVTMAAIPAAIALLSWLVLKERISGRVLCAIGLAVMGIALFAFAKPSHGAEDGTATSQHSWMGQLLLIGAVFCEASYAVIGKKLTGSLSPKRIAALINLWGFALTTPFGLYLAMGFDFGAISMPTWWLLLAYALAACVFTVWLWMTGLQLVPASQSAVFTVMLPVSAALVGVVFLGESLSGLQLLAFGIAVSSLVLATAPVPGRGQADARH